MIVTTNLFSYFQKYMAKSFSYNINSYNKFQSTFNLVSHMEILKFKITNGSQLLLISYRSASEIYTLINVLFLSHSCNLLLQIFKDLKYHIKKISELSVKNTNSTAMEFKVFLQNVHLTNQRL